MRQLNVARDEASCLRKVINSCGVMVRHMAGQGTIVSHYLLSEQIMDRVTGAAKNTT